MPQKRKHPHKKRHLIRSRFYRRLITVFLFLLAVNCAGFLLLWLYLADYQKCLPDAQTDAVVTAFQKKDTVTLCSLCSTLPSSLQNAGHLKSYLEGTYQPADVICYEDSTAASDDRRYLICDGTKQLAVLTLQPDSHSSFWGHTAYHIAGLKLNPLHVYTITAPSDITVYINGSPIDSRYLSASAAQTDVFAAAGLTDSSVSTYVINDLNYIDTLTADGCTVSKASGAADTWHVSRTLSSAGQEQLSAFAEKFAESYTVFATRKNESSAAVLSMILPDCTLYRSVSAYNNDWGQTYDTDRYDRLAVTNMQKYGDHAYSCEIAFTYVITNSSGTEKSYDFHYILYITDVNGQYQVLQMKSD